MSDGGYEKYDGHYSKDRLWRKLTEFPVSESPEACMLASRLRASEMLASGANQRVETETPQQTITGAGTNPDRRRNHRVEIVSSLEYKGRVTLKI